MTATVIAISSRAAGTNLDDVRPGTTVVVHSANGGVGSTLVQLARHAGVRVIGTCSPHS